MWSLLLDHNYLFGSQIVFLWNKESTTRKYMRDNPIKKRRSKHKWNIYECCNVTAIPTISNHYSSQFNYNTWMELSKKGASFPRSEKVDNVVTNSISFRSFQQKLRNNWLPTEYWIYINLHEQNYTVERC